MVISTLNPQNQQSFQILRLSTFRFQDNQFQFKSYNLIIKLRGGGCYFSANLQLTAEPTKTIKKIQPQKKQQEPENQQQQGVYQSQIRPQAIIINPIEPYPIDQNQTSHEEIVNLILQIGQKEFHQEANERVKIIQKQIPNLIEGNNNILNEFLSLLVLQFFRKNYQTEFNQNQHQNFILGEFKHQYEIIKTAFQGQLIDNDQQMIQYSNNWDVKFLQDLISQIKIIELKITVSDFFDYKDYSFKLISKLTQCFEQLFWIYFNLDKDVILQHLDYFYKELIQNSKSIQVLNQWITLVSNLYIIRPFQAILDQSQINELNKFQLFRELNKFGGIILYQDVEKQNYIQISTFLKTHNITARYNFINSLTKQNQYLLFQKDEKKYFVKQIYIKNEDYEQGFLLQHFEIQLEHSHI